MAASRPSTRPLNDPGRADRRKVTAVLGAAALLLVVLGGVAVAARLGTSQDFAPYTMQITWWTASATQREGSPPEPGTAAQLLEYRSIDSWRLTTVQSSWDPSIVGTSVEVDRGTHSTFLSQAQRLFSRIIPEEEGRMAPMRWLIPGLMDELPQQGFVRATASPSGTATFISKDAKAAGGSGDPTELVEGSAVVFDLSTHLPISVRTYAGGELRESFDFKVVSSP